MAEEIPVTSIEEIMTEVVAGASAHSAATEIFQDQFQFYGQTLSEWMDLMSIKIPKDPTPQEMRSLYVELAQKYQRASIYYTVANSIHGAIINGGEIKKSDLVKALVDRYAGTAKKRPAASIIERMAESYMNSTVHTKIAARIVKDFWKERRDTLVEIRKNLEQVSISMHTEMKYLEQGA